MLYSFFCLWLVIIGVVLLIGHISFWCRIYENGFGVLVFTLTMPLFPIFGLVNYLLELKTNGKFGED